jgi:DNA-binding ferritin-like protein
MEEKKIKRILEEYKKETKRHFDVVAEKIEDKIALVAEQVAANTEKLKEHDKRFDKIEDTLEVIKLDIEFIKNELKQKVSRDEFAALEKRVSLLEAKVNKLK